MREVYGQEVLDQFQLTEKDFLGAGGESRVYKLDSERVLRIFSPNTLRQKITVLENFYDHIDSSELDVKVPVIFSIDELGDYFYSIEELIEGDSLANQLPQLDGVEREKHLRAYAEAVDSVAKIKHTFNTHGEVIEVNPVTDDQWARYLIRRANKTLETSLPSLKKEIPSIHSLFDIWQTEVANIFTQQPEPKLVHGDYFPGNVITNAKAEVTAIIDFSPMTVIGDWKMDAAGALLFLEVTNGYKQADSVFVHDLMQKLYGLDEKTIEVYRIYYSLYFSHTEKDDSTTYQWCLKNLHTYNEKHNL